MKQWVLHNRNGMEVINLHHTKEVLDSAMESLKNRAATGAVAVLVGTQPALADLVEATAKEMGIPVVNRRWIGGTLTNFKGIFKRVEHFKKLKKDMAEGVYDKYTKKERVGLFKEIEKMESMFGGLSELSRVPDLLIVIDPVVHEIAVHEAKVAKIPVLALSNVDTDPDSVEFPILGNTTGRTSVAWFLEKLKGAWKAGRAAAVVAPIAPVAPAARTPLA
jgi:small subunit ribosomal protein S2